MNAIADAIGYDAVHRVGWTLAHFLWQGALVAVVLALLLAAGSRWSARVRYAVAYGALLVAAALPLVTWAWLTPGQRDASGAVTIADVPERVMTRGAGPAEQPAPAVGSMTPVGPDHGIEMYLPPAVGTWLVGVIALALYRAGGWLYVMHLRRAGRPADDPRLRAALERLRGTMRVARDVRIVHCPRINSPAVVGAITPVILLPLACMLHLSPQQLEAILAHELAHVRRHDYFFNLIQTAIETLLFFHPAIWWISRRIRIEREHACDDLAVRATGDRAAYAAALAALEELRAAPPPAPALAARGGALLARVRRILRGSDATRRANWWPAAALGAVAVTLVLTAAAARLSANDQPATEAMSRTATIECVDENGRPVPGADVYLVDWSRLNGQPKVSAPGPVKSGDDGVAKFTNLPNPSPLRGQLVAYARVPGKLAGLAEQSPDMLGGGPLDKPVRLILRPAVLVRGRVAAPPGTDLRQAVVRVHSIGNTQVDAGRITSGGSLHTGWMKFAERLAHDVFTFEVGADGTLELRDIPDNGGVTVSVEAPGLAREYAGAGLMRKRDPNFEINLRPQAVIEGKIKTPAGVALPPEATVRATSDGRPARIGHNVPFEIAPGPDGSFRFDRLPEDVYLIQLLGVPDGWVAPIDSVRVGYGEVRKDLAIPLGPGREIRGTVVDAVTGKPLSGASVAVESTIGFRGERVSRSQTTGADGRFIANVPPGSVAIQVSQYPAAYSADHENRQNERVELTVREGEDVPDVTLKLKEGVRPQPDVFLPRRPWTKITGRVVDRDGTPVAGVPVGIRTAEERRPGAPGLSTWSNGVTKADGSYEVGGEPAEGVRLVAFLNEGPTSAAVSDPIIPRDDVGTALVKDIVVDKLPVRSEISGVLVDQRGQPVAGVSVAISGIRNETTDSAGRFRFDLFDVTKSVELRVQATSYQDTSWYFIPPGTRDARFVLRPVNPKVPEWSDPPPLPDPAKLIGQGAPELNVTWVVRPAENAQPPTLKRADGKSTAVLFVARSTDVDAYRRQIESFAEACAAGRGAEPVVILSQRFHESAVRGILAGAGAKVWAGIDRPVEDDSPLTFPGATLFTYGSRGRRDPTIFVVDPSGVVRYECNTTTSLVEFLEK
jgi:beta-lactamase regulating signal transducer with metallopeptidase domain